ncbi:uncharacterized protein [Palaemon carinicauda]|uniref:uncharacterized protein n=1 Tax=Palaemon carinicauda TaxID=392227 RepID=UPI0035B5D91A
MAVLRRSVQTWHLQAGYDSTKKVSILVKSLPVNVVTDVQWRLKPVKLSDATHENIKETLIAQYEVKKSVIGATVQFLYRKQLPDESIENYARALNDLCSNCNYKDCCRDRSLRDAFVSGLRSASILSGLLQDCENKSFNECVEKAKLLATFSADAQDIKPECNHHTSYKVTEHRAKGIKKVPTSYICIRCGQQANHFANDCFTMKLKCRKCQKTGRLARCCKSTAKSLHTVSEPTPRDAATTQRDVATQHKGMARYDQTDDDKGGFEIDSGSHVSTICQSDAARARVVISPTKHRVCGYSGNAINLCGEAYVNVTYGHKMSKHKFLIVNSSDVNLLGRDLCQKMDIKIVLPDVMLHSDKVNNVNVSKYDDIRNRILCEFKTYIRDEFQSDVKHTVSLNVMSDAKPIFARA